MSTKMSKLANTQKPAPAAKSADSKQNQGKMHRRSRTGMFRLSALTGVLAPTLNGF